MWKNPLLYKSLDMKRARYLVVDGSFSYLPLADESREVIFKIPIALGWRKLFLTVNFSRQERERAKKRPRVFLNAICNLTK